jgi:cytoskeleton protein RodZ
MRQGTLGEQLRTAREATGLDVREFAVRTKVRADYLTALEQDDLTALPERLFTRSYLQRYAHELGLDEAALLAEFDRVVPQRPEIAQALKGQLHVRRGPSLPLGLIAAALSGVLVVGALSWWGYSTWQASAGTTAPVAPTPAVQSTPAAVRNVSLTVDSRPRGAKVYLDNRLLGVTPVREFPLEARESGRLRVELSGHKIASGNVALDQDRRVSAELQREDAEAKSSLVTSVVAPASAKPTEAATTAEARPEANKPNAAQDAASAKPSPIKADPAKTETAKPPAAKPDAATPAAAQPQVAKPQAAKPDAAPTEAARPAPAPTSGVVLQFRGRSWVRVTGPDGRVLYEGTPAVGSTQTFPKGVRVRAGSAGAVLATSGAGQAQPLGGNGQVVERRY